jgi:hypothetical protein
MWERGQGGGDPVLVLARKVEGPREKSNWQPNHDDDADLLFVVFLAQYLLALSGRAALSLR